MSEQNEPEEGGLGGLLGKAKGFLTDERIDTLADKLKDIAPDSLDAKIDALAEKAKDAND